MTLLRRSIALLLLGFFVTQFAMTALVGPGQLTPAYTALAVIYGAAFVGVGAEWFWARWFAMGIGQFGSLLLLVLAKTGFEPIIAILGGAHLLITLLLSGEGMAAHYERSAQVAERYNFSEDSLAVMRRAVRSAGTTLPPLVLYTLGPKQEAAHLMALVLGVAGVTALLRQRTIGLLAMGAAGALALADAVGAWGLPSVGYLALDPNGHHMVYGPIAPLLAAAMLLPALSTLPAMVRFVRAR